MFKVFVNTLSINKNSFNLYINWKGKFCFILGLWLLVLGIIFFIIYNIINDISSPILCMAGDDLDKEVQGVSEATKNVSASNNSINVDKPEIHLHNPNLKIPGELGTGIGMGGAVSAGIYALSKSRAIASMPIGMKAAAIVGGGLAGGTAFVTSNYLNTMAQKNINNSSSTNTPGSSTNDPYPAKSIIGEGDDIDNIMYFLNINIIICVIILFLSLLLIYLYVYKRKYIRGIFIFWVTLMIISLYSIYLAINLLDDFDIITNICQNIDNSNKSITNFDWHNSTIQFLIGNLIIRCCISLFLYLLLVLHIYYLIANNNKIFIFLKHIWGERLYSYIIKTINIAKKTNWIWMTFCAILLLFSSTFSIWLAYMIYCHIFDITEFYLNSKK